MTFEGGFCLGMVIFGFILFVVNAIVDTRSYDKHWEKKKYEWQDDWKA